MKFMKFLVALVILLSATLQAETVTYYHTDALGTPVAATDESGNVLWREHYSPFGEKLDNSQASQSNTVGYTGHQFDSDTGLVYMQARYYDPVIGRFYSNDPVGFSRVDNFNRYAYAANNPYRYTDPDGRDIYDINSAIYNNGGPVEAFNHTNLSAAQANFIVDVTPGIGDAKGFHDAYTSPSVVNISAAIVGLVPLVGDIGSKIIKSAKPDFIVSPAGTVIPTNKDFNLVDSHKKGGDWFQIHNNHNDAKVGGSPHTHYPLQHGHSRTREIKRTNGADLDKADSALKSGAMRVRKNRRDKGGQ